MQNNQYVGPNVQPQYPQNSQNISNAGVIEPVKRNNLKVAQNILTGVLTTLVIVLAGFAIKVSVFDQEPIDEIQNSEVLGLNTEGYSAVFLVNGQVYFGKIVANSQFELQLEDVFFLRVDEPSLSGEEEQQASSEPLLSLVQRSKSLHKPIDPMTLNKSQVILIEPLAADSEVIEAIEQIKLEG
jgi:hypothetical protein